MPSNKQAQPLKPLIKTWEGWERGVGYLPESDEDETKGLYFANGVIGIHGELRPAPYFRPTALKSHILRRIYDAAGNREAAAIALQIPNAVQGTQPTVQAISSKNGATSAANATAFFVGTFQKPTINGADVVTHNANFPVKGAMFWSADGELNGTDATSKAGAGGMIGFADGTTENDRSISWNAEDNAGDLATEVIETLLNSDSDLGTATVPTIFQSTGTQHGGPPSFTVWNQPMNIYEGRLSIITIIHQSAIQNNGPTSFTFPGNSAVPTLLASVAFSSTARINTYAVVPDETFIGFAKIEWAQNQLDASFENTTWAGVVTSGTNGADAIIQTVTGSDNRNTARSVGLAPLENPGNIIYGGIMTSNNFSAITPGTNFNELAERSIDQGSHTLQTQWRIGAQTPSNPVSDWTVLSGLMGNMIGLEIAVTTTGKNSFTTSQYTPHANRLVLLVIDSLNNELGGVPAVPSSVTGTTGLSWTRVESQMYDNSSIATRSISVWRALKTSGVSSGTETIDYNGVTQTSIKYIFTEYTNVNLTVDGAGAIQQSSDDVNDSTTTPSTTLGTFDHVDNATYGVHAVDNDSSITAGSGFTSVANPRGNGSLMVEFKNTNDTSVNATCTSGNTASIAIEIEFVAAGSAASNVSRSYFNSAIHFVNEDADSPFPSALCTFVGGGDNDNNMTLNWSNNGSGTADAINFILFGGTDVETEVVEWTNDTGSTTTQEITGLTNVPTCLITIGALLTSLSTSVGLNTVFGITDGVNQFVQNFNAVHASEPTSSSRRTSKTYSIQNQLGNETTVIENLDPPTGTGFTWRHTQAWSTGYKWATLAIKGILAEVGQFTRETSSGGQAATSISITSDAFILTSLSTVSDDTDLGSASWSLGAASELGESAASAWTDENAQTSPDNYAVDWQQASATTVSHGEDVVWVELNEENGSFDVVAGVAKMDIGLADWLWLDDTDSQSLGAAVLINYVGFTAASDPAFSTDSFNTTGNQNANTELIVAIATKNVSAVTSVVFNTNESLSQIAGSADNTDTSTYALELWHITNPTDTSATVIISTVSTVDIIVGMWLVEGASSDFSSGTFTSDDVDTNDYFSAGVAFNQPDASFGLQNLNNIDLILGVSVDDSEVQDSGSADSGVSYTATTATDTGEALGTNVYKGYTITGTKTKTSMSINTNTATVFTGHQPGWGNGTPTGGANEDPWEISGTSVGSLENISFDQYKTAMHMVGTYLDTIYHKWQAHWYMEESIGTDDQYLYVSRGRPGDATNTAPDVIDPPVIINKIDLRNSSDMFGEDLGFVEFTDITFPGQMARYKGNWFFPSSGTTNPRKLTVGTGAIDNDTWPALTQATGDVKTVEHLANGAGTGGFQLVGMRATKGWRETISEIASGVDVNPDQEDGWASYFGAGDKDERAAGLSAVGGGDVFLNKDGLWSYYPDTGRSSLIFEDFKIWRSLFDNIPISPWRGGLLMPHPSGLLFWTPGQLPINIGFDGKTKSYADPPTNVTNYNQGRYLGVVGVGDFIYTLYQPDITSSEINVLCGYLHKSDRVEEVVWQVIGTTFLYNANYNSNVGVSLLGKPISSAYETPTLWFNNGNNLNHIYLDDRAGPFRSIQRLTSEGFALLPEMFFPERIDMSEMIIYTQGMRPNSDSWQVSMFADNGTEIKLGAAIIKNGRTTIKIDRHNVYRVMFKLTWSGSNKTESPKIIGADIAINDNGANNDTIVSASSAFGQFIVGDEIIISGTTSNDGSYTLIAATAGTLTLVTGEFASTEISGNIVTVEGRYRETPAIKRIELYGQPTTRGASGGNN